MLLAGIALAVQTVRSRQKAEPRLESGIHVEVSGCAAIVAGAVCELPGDGAIRLWVGATPEGPTFATASAPVAATLLRDVERGSLYRVIVPSNSTELRVITKEGATARVVRLAAAGAPAWLERARALRQKGDVEGALAQARAAETSGDPAERAFALGLRARIELAAGRTEVSFGLFREAVALHRGAGRLSDAADDGFALAFALNQRSHRYTEARRALDEARTDTETYPDGRAREAYYRGTLATETGDARGALQLLREARERAARLGLGLLERNARNAYALQLMLIGRTREALDLLAKLDADARASADASPCEKAELAINTGFGALLVNEDTTTPKVDADAPLRRALALCSEGCQDKYLRTAALGNLALSALGRSEPAVARGHLKEARARTNEARAAEVLFWHELDGRIALAEGSARAALTAFEEEARLAHGALAFEAEWRARTGLGEALERLGKPDDALAQYRQAEELLDEVSLLVPLGEGRGTFLGDRGKSAQAAVDLLVRRGRVADALDVVRRSRARVVGALARTARVEGFGDADRTRWESALQDFRGARAALDAEAENDWRLPRAEAARARALRETREAELRAALDTALSMIGGRDRLEGRRCRGATCTPTDRSEPRQRLTALPTDALTLAFHPVRSGWIAIAADASGASAYPLPAVTPMTGAVLAPMRARLDRARRLRVLAHGPLRAVDFHALVDAGEPLVARMSVEYPLDLPPTADSTEREARAVVISDPTLDLPSSRAEADAIARLLRDRAWVVDLLSDRAATNRGLLPLLGSVRLLHYAGHGVFAGREGWESALPLAAGTHLTVGDILASRTVPPRIVLSGCETARASEDGPIESLGIAQAFVIAGADFVIAPVRPIDDALTARLATALYGELASRESVDAAEALRTAQLGIFRDRPDLDWSAFRVLRR